MEGIERLIREIVRDELRKAAAPVGLGGLDFGGLLVSKGRTLDRLALESGVATSTLRNLRGGRGTPQNVTVRKVAQALAVSEGDVRSAFLASRSMQRPKVKRETYPLLELIQDERLKARAVPARAAYTA